VPVEVVDETGSAAALEAHAVRVVEAVLAGLGRPGDDVSVLLVADSRMRELNRDWRGKDAPTDVLSFSQVEGEPLAGAPALLGDVVVSVDTLARQARDGGWTDAEELARLLLHGVLHLLGHDHEREDEALAMRAEEQRLVHALGGAGIAVAWDETAA
jgi:probable rRNA maturation factor